MKVTALLVSHNGSRWLPQVISALQEMSSSPDALVAVDTGSTDDSVSLLTAAFGVPPVQLDEDTSYAAAVRAGLAALPPGRADEWIWLLHDDGAPGPRCLARLVSVAENADPEVAVIGPKLREWPSLKRLLEVGVTISGSGRRETGLETGEYDQGQHDSEDPVLAVNTAGMLIRRQVLEEIGLADELPIFGNDLDFGWRLASRGHQVRVSPEAVMFHVEAAHRGQRAGTLTRRPRRDERAAAMFVLLANGSATGQPLRLVRLLVGGMLRALGFLVIRAPKEARDELAAIGRVYGAPRRVLTARRVRRRAATVSSRAVRPLLAPAWMPWRHGLDFFIDFARALVHLGREALERRNTGRALSSSPLSRLVRSPSVWVLAIGLVVALVASRDLLHGAPLRGGGLLAAPAGVGHWWHLWADSWHWIGQGSAEPGPAYLLPMAVAGTVAFGQPGLVVWLLFCLGVPLALVGALRFLRRLTRGGWAPVWGAATYALLPALSGSVSQGRLGTLAGIVVLPWLATAALGLADPDPDRRARAVWRTALLAGLLVAFVPVAFLIVVVLIAAAPGLGARQLRPAQLAVIALAPLVLVAPWLPALMKAPGALLVEAGRAGSVSVDPDVWHLIAGNSAGPGSAPFWLTLGIPFAAVVALLRTDTRSRVVRLWAVALVAALAVALLSRVTVSLPGIPVEFRAWPGFVMLVVLAALVAAIVVAADGVGTVIGGASFGWRQPVVAVAVLGALFAPVAGAGWWLSHGTSEPLHRSAAGQVPAYMSELAAARHDSAALVVSGGPGARHHRVVQYRIVRSAIPRLGDDGVLAMTEPTGAVTSALASLVGPGSDSAAQVLAGYGIAYVFAPAPVSPAVAGSLDASSGFASASAPNPHTRAWRVVPTPSLTAIHQRGSVLHPWLLVVQVLALVSALALTLPTSLLGRSQA